MNEQLVFLVLFLSIYKKNKTKHDIGYTVLVVVKKDPTTYLTNSTQIFNKTLNKYSYISIASNNVFIDTI